MKPLEGIRVAEFAQWVAGPAAGVILAHLGAEVIHVEHPKRGDGLRGLRSDILRGIFKSSGVSDEAGGDFNLIWELVNRGKSSLAVDLASAEGREIADRLIKTADVVVTGLRPYELDKFNLNAERIHSVNDKAVVVHLTGWGTKGPRADLPGYDHTCFWASTGFQAKLTQEGKEPPYPRPALGDLTCALAVSGAVMGGLVGRLKSGKGNVAEVSLYGVGMWASSSDLQTVLLTGRELAPHNREAAHNPMANVYRTSDDRWLMLQHLQSDLYWPKLCEAIAVPDLVGDDRFTDFEARRVNARELVSILDNAFGSHALSYWQDRLDEFGLVWAPLRTPTEVTQDEQARANPTFSTLQHPTRGPVEFVDPPIHFRDGDEEPMSTAPELGQQTEEILLDLGYDWGAIQELKKADVVN